MIWVDCNDFKFYPKVFKKFADKVPVAILNTLNKKGVLKLWDLM